MTDENTDIIPIDQRPLSTTQISGQTAWFHQLSDQEIGDAMGKFTDGEVRILALAARGVAPKEILRQTSIKAVTFTRLKKRQLFRDAYYSLAADTRPITIEGIRTLAQSHAVDSTMNIIDLANADTETAAEHKVKLEANKEVLSLAGATVSQGIPSVQIGQLLVNLVQQQGTKPPWES